MPKPTGAAAKKSRKKAAAKRKSGKKVAKKKKKARKKMPAKWKKHWDRRKKMKKFKKLTPCPYDLSDKDLCRFLIGFTEKFWPDYMQVREALMNVERRAFEFGTLGSPDKAMAGDGQGDDPPPPPPPPTFN